jgi:SAM-dependent methyltransferase
VLPEIDEHRKYLNDQSRVAAYAHAIAESVRRGDVVVDLGSGTGILGLLACRAGAKRVYSIEQTGMIEVARAICASNGFDDRVTFLNGHSRGVELPEKADVVVSDQVGYFGFDADAIEILADARERFLKPGILGKADRRVRSERRSRLGGEHLLCAGLLSGSTPDRAGHAALHRRVGRGVADRELRHQ